MKKTIVVLKPDVLKGTGIFVYNDDDFEAKEITQEEAENIQAAFHARQFEELHIAPDGIFMLAGKKLIRRENAGKEIP